MRRRTLRVQCLEERHLLAADPFVSPAVESWTQRGGNAGHTSYVDVRLNPDLVTEEWSQTLGYEQSGTGSWHERAVAIDDSRVYRTALEGYAPVGTYHVIAYDAETGSEVWHQTLGGHAFEGVGEPSVAGNIVYVNSAGHSSSSGGGGLPTLYGFNAETGALTLSRTYEAQHGSNERPVIEGDQLVVEDGYYGGISAYTASTLDEQWHNSGSIYTAPYAALDDEYVYAYSEQVFRRSDGSRLADITDSTLRRVQEPIVSDSGRVLFDAAAYVDDSTTRAAVSAFDGDSHSLLWTTMLPNNPTHVTAKAVGDGRAAVLGGDKLFILDEADGQQLRSWQAPAGFSPREVILTQNHAIVQVSSRDVAQVHAIDLATGEESLLFEHRAWGFGTMEMAMRENRLFLSHHLFVRALNLGAVNTELKAADDSGTTDEDAPLTIPVLANDSRINSDSLTVASLSDPENGTALLNSDGTVTYTPDADFHGTDRFTYWTTDGTNGSNAATVTITVNSVSDAPVAVDDAYSVEGNMVLSVSAPGLLGNDSHTKGDPLTAAVASEPSHGTVTVNDDGSFTYTPEPNFTGTDSFTYRANDGLADSGSATVTITIIPPNRAPVATDDTYSISEDGSLGLAVPGVLGNDNDPDGDAMTARVVSDPSAGSLIFKSDGSLSYVPNRDFHGSDSFTYVANDGTVDSNVATVEILVDPVNDAPKGLVLDDSSVFENTDTSSAVAVGALSATDVDDASHTFSLVSGTGDAGNGLFQIDGGLLQVRAGTVLNHEAQAVYSVRVQASDGDATTEEVFSITVADANDPPVADALELGTEEDVPVAVNLMATDEDGDELRFSIVSSPSSGTLIPVAGQPGDYVYTPDAGFTGSDSFVYTAGDGTTSSEEATVVITVAPPAVPTVEIDIKPGSASNSLNPRSRGVTKVAILSTPSFDAVGGIDAKTLTFGRTGDEASLIIHRKHATPRTEAKDVDGDGLLDLVAAFSTNRADLQAGDTRAVLRGQTVDGERLEGQDIVRTVGNRKSGKGEGELARAAEIHVLDEMWTNWTKPMDVNDGGRVSGLDALLGINALNRGRGGVLPMLAEDAEIDFPFVDTNGDGKHSAFDSRLVIKRLNRFDELAEAEHDDLSGSDRAKERHSLHDDALASVTIEKDLDRRSN